MPRFTADQEAYMSQIQTLRELIAQEPFMPDVCPQLVWQLQSLEVLLYHCKRLVNVMQGTVPRSDSY